MNGMTPEDSAELLTAMHGLLMAQEGRLRATEALLDALVITVGLKVPAAVPALQQHLANLLERQIDLQPDSVVAFQDRADLLQDQLAALSRAAGHG